MKAISLDNAKAKSKALDESKDYTSQGVRRF